MSDRPLTVEAPIDADRWRLRLASLGDVDGVHGLATEPLVYRYLFDAMPPTRDSIGQGIARARRDAVQTGRAYGS